MTTITKSESIPNEYTSVSFTCEKTVLTSKTLELIKKNWNIQTEKWNHFHIVQSNVHFKDTFTDSWDSWSKRLTV